MRAHAPVAVPVPVPVLVPVPAPAPGPPGRRPLALAGVSALLAAALAACGADDVAPPRPLGPHDGRDLPAVDTGRVAVGDVAPDFTLESYGDGVITLSDYRGQKDVILVFYRGHW